MNPRSSSLHTAPGRGRRWRVKALAALTVLWLTESALPASAADREFGLLVHHIESYYHARRSHRLLIAFAGGFANVVIAVWRPAGVKNFKLALFEDQDFSASRYDLDFPLVVRAGLNEGWHPLVQVWSRRDGERTYVFAKDGGRYVKLLVATLEGNEAAVVEVKVNPDKLNRCIEHWTEKPDRHDDRPNPERDTTLAELPIAAGVGRVYADAGAMGVP